MARTRFVAIGDYNETDARALDEMGAVRVPSLADALALPEADRASVAAIAYKGGSAVDGEVLDAFPALGVLANYGVGYDAIDVGAATARGVAVTNTPDVLNDDVADIAVGMLLMQMRRMRQADAHVRSGAWAEGQAFPLNRKLAGTRVGILGLGRIGFEISDRLAAFKMDVHYWSRSRKETPGWTWHDSPLALAQAVDVLVVAVVGGPATENIVSREVLEALGPDGVLVNISRGSTVDEAALLDALESGRLAGAGLDVFETEPKIDPRFAALDEVVLQPHQGSATHATRAAMGKLQRANVAAFLKGETLPTRVN